MMGSVLIVSVLLGLGVVVMVGEAVMPGVARLIGAVAVGGTRVPSGGVPVTLSTGVDVAVEVRVAVADGVDGALSKNRRSCSRRCGYATARVQHGVHSSTYERRLAMDLTQSEIKSLMEQARREERVAKTLLKQRSAALRARMEEQLAAAYRADHERWKAITEEAARRVKEWDDQIAAICRDMGVPEEFRPSLNLSWYSRGENASSARRAELRKVGEARIAELETAGQAAIEVRSVQIQRELVAGGLKSDEAKRLLASLPNADELMPDLSLDELEQALPLPQPPPY
jgi:hypothetical protein